MTPPPSTPVAAEVRRALGRCRALRDRLLHSLPPSKFSPPARLTLLRLVDAELRFLSRLSSSASSHPISNPLPTNLGYLESIARVLLHPSVFAVSRVCKPLRLSAHVDVVATLGRTPTWFLVSDRNPHHLPWFGPKGLRARVERVLAAARSAGALTPASVLFVFSSGLTDEAATRMVNDFGAVEIDFFGGWDLFEELEEGWVGVRAKESKVFEIKIDSGCGDDGVVPLGIVEDGGKLGLGDGVFGSLISKMSPRSGGELVEDRGAPNALATFRGPLRPFDGHRQCFRRPSSLSLFPPPSLSFPPWFPCFHVGLGPARGCTNSYCQLADMSSSSELANLVIFH